MKIKTILVDDERKSLVILRTKLEKHCPEIEIINETQDPLEAIELIQEFEPDLVFLDIAMPELSGFEILSKFENPKFEIIFATAFDQYAIEAIKQSAIGYLLKPVDNIELKEVVNKVKHNIKTKTTLERNKHLVDNLVFQKNSNKKLVIPTLKGYEFISINSIIHCDSNEGYTTIHLQKKKSILSSHRLSHFSKMLEEYPFFQVHKSHLVNLDNIESYHNDGFAVMSNGNKIPVSRYRKSEFLSKLV